MNISSSQVTPISSASVNGAKPDRAGPIITILLLIWIGLVSLGAQAGGWLGEQIFIAVGLTWPKPVWPVISAGQSLLLLGPLLLLVWGWRGKAANSSQAARYQAIFQTWAISAGFILALLPIRLIALPAAQRHVGPQILLTLVYGGLVLGMIWLYERNRRPPMWRTLGPVNGKGLLISLALVPLLAYPWLAWGALGSPIDTALNLMAGLSFGLVATLILGYFLIRPLRYAEDTTQSTILWAGFAAGAALLLLTSPLSLNGMQLLLMLTVPALAWALIGLSRLGQTGITDVPWLSFILLIGLGTAIPMIWVDPDELLLVLSSGAGEILGWVFVAVEITLFIGGSLGLLLSLTGQRPIWQKRPILITGLFGAWLVGASIYLTGGQVGFYGDRLFVILKDQADLSAASAIDDIDDRRQYVYTTLTEHANQTQANLRAALDRRRVNYKPYYLVNALDVQGGPFLKRWLSAQPEVDRILHNPILRPLPEPIPLTTGAAPAPTEPGWNLTTIGADRVWKEFGATGAGVVIGQSDSGVEWQHPELKASYRGRDGQHDYNWLDPWYATTEPTDIGGHGTHTLGSIVGQTTGVAPGATWYGCVNLARNLANPALYLDCMQFMLAPYPPTGDPFSNGDPTRSADVLNNSWGCPDLEGCDPDAFQPGVKALRQAGIFIVVSAGNDGLGGCETIHSPLALYDEVFSVGAIDQKDRLTEFSSRGPVTIDGSGRPKPDIVAPGADILSAYPGSTYEYADGTSMAGPHVAGVVALIWSANPNLIGQIDETEEILRQTATPITTKHTECGDLENAIGRGKVDAYAAVKMALEQGISRRE